MQIQCNNCNTYFYKKPHRVSRSKTHFCSHSCHMIFKNKKSTKQEVECCICGKKHLKLKKDAERNTKNFCSDNCFRTKIVLNCTVCGKDFRKSAFHENNGLCKSCYLKNFFKNNPDKLFQKRLKNRSRWRIINGVPLEKPVMKRSQNGYIGTDGYKIIYKDDHQNSWECGRIHEHVWVMSEYLKRPLYHHENVHHKNGVRDDNRIENLELWSIKQPPGQRVEDKIKFYKEFLQEHGYQIIDP